MATVKSTREQLRSRGYPQEEDLEIVRSLAAAEMVSLLASPSSAVRTAAVRSIVALGPLDDAATNQLVDALRHETQLYTKLELSSALERGGAVSTRALIPWLGLIGTNQHRRPDVKEFKKSSYPLPRDIVARILARVDVSTLPLLTAALKKSDRVALTEAVDAVGFMCFYAANGDRAEKRAALDALLDLYSESRDDDLLRWKVVRCFQSFNAPQIYTLLNEVEHSDSHPVLRQEARRSLNVVQTRQAM